MNKLGGIIAVLAIAGASFAAGWRFDPSNANLTLAGGDLLLPGAAHRTASG